MEEEFKYTAEGVKQYAARKKREKEIKNDKKFKALLKQGHFDKMPDKLTDKVVESEKV